MEKMSSVRAKSSPDLVPCSTKVEQYDDSALEGVAANIKLLLKLIQDHKDACHKHTNDGRRMLRVAGMMTVLDNVRTRIQKCQSFGNKRSEADLRQCNTDLKLDHVPPRDKKPIEGKVDEKETLRKELNASLAARKSLESMCSSLGKEKEIMATELARKVHVLNEMEELINDLKAQNETLLGKVREKNEGGDKQGNATLQERNRVLSEQLLRSLDGYKSMKRKLKEALEENGVIRKTMKEMGVKVGASLDRIRGFKQRIDAGSENFFDIEEEISELEQILECLDMEVSKHVQNRGECVAPKGEINACKPSVLA